MSFHATFAATKRLQALLVEFGLPANTTDVGALRASYHRLAKLHHPDRLPGRQAEANAEFAQLQARFAEAMQLLEKRHASLSYSKQSTSYIFSHGGLFYHDPYKWRLEKGYARAEALHATENAPQATLATKLKGLSLLACILGGAFYIFDRTATGSTSFF